jgi:hypothetical protein
MPIGDGGLGNGFCLGVAGKDLGKVYVGGEVAYMKSFS